VTGNALLDFLKIVVVFPTNWLGFLIGIGLPLLLTFWRKLSIFDWLAMAFFNVPSLIYIASSSQQLPGQPTTSVNVMSTVGITFLGLGGFGLGWLLLLISLSLIRFLQRDKHSN